MKSISAKKDQIVKRIPTPLAVSSLVFVLYCVLIGIQSSRYDELLENPVLDLGSGVELELDVKEVDRGILTRDIQIGVKGEPALVNTHVSFGVFPRITNTLIPDVVERSGDARIFAAMQPKFVVQLSPNLKVSRLSLSTKAVEGDALKAAVRDDPVFYDLVRIGELHANLEFMRTKNKLDYSIGPYETYAASSEGQKVEIVMDADNPEVFTFKSESGASLYNFDDGGLLSFKSSSVSGRSRFIEKNGVYTAAVKVSDLNIPSFYAKPMQAAADVRFEWPDSVSPLAAAASLVIGEAAAADIFPYFKNTGLIDDAFSRFIGAMLDGKVFFCVDKSSLTASDFNINAEASVKLDQARGEVGRFKFSVERTGEELPDALRNSGITARRTEAEYVVDSYLDLHLIGKTTSDSIQK